MKRYILFFVGCLMSLTIAAQGQVPVVEHDTIFVDCDPYTCHAKSPVSISSTYTGVQGYQDAQYIALYEINRLTDMPDLVEKGYFEDIQSFTLQAPYVGLHTYIILTYKNMQINAPIRRAANGTATLIDEQYPKPNDRDYDYLQYDVYYVRVNYHTEHHRMEAIPDMITNQANVLIKTTAYTIDPQTNQQFCGMDIFYRVYKEGGSSPVELTYGRQDTYFEPDSVKMWVTMGIGTHIYKIYIYDRLNEIMWCDSYAIYVPNPTCTSGLVYAKWDDFMFVDNGEGGGKGDFVSYQWYKEGSPISGATRQWIRTTMPEYENAAPSGRYYVLITDKDGKSFFTCPSYFEDLPKSAVSNPHPNNAAPMRKTIKNGQLYVIYEGQTYDAQGRKVEN